MSKSNTPRYVKSPKFRLELISRKNFVYLIGGYATLMSNKRKNEIRHIEQPVCYHSIFLMILVLSKNFECFKYLGV